MTINPVDEADFVIAIALLPFAGKSVLSFQTVIPLPLVVALPARLPSTVLVASDPSFSAVPVDPAAVGHSFTFVAGVPPLQT